MIMYDFDCRIHHCAVMFVDATGEVDIFGIHEKARVEESDFAKCVCAQEHETT